MHLSTQCDEDKKDEKLECPTLSGPPTVHKPGPLVLTFCAMLLESIGAHGFIAFFGGLMLVLGFIKLSFGGIICCRKSKRQEHAQRLLKKGVPPKSEHQTKGGGNPAIIAIIHRGTL